jgi:hypothetical protein
MRRQLCELGADLIEREANALCEDDECDSSQNRSRIPALAAAGSLGRDEPAVLIKTERGGGYAAATRHFANEEQVIHSKESIVTSP